MRDLVEEIEEYYLLLEIGNKPPSSEIETDDDGNNNKGYRQTNLAKYHHVSEFKSPNRFHKDFSGIHHVVDWNTIHSKNNMTDKDRHASLRDALHLHHHFIKHKTDIGDVVENNPMRNNKDSGIKTNKNKREELYRKKGGFGAAVYDKYTDMDHQYGIVKQHPHDHEDESKRGQKYLHPLEHHEIESHGNEPSVGASDGKIRSLSHKFTHQTIHNTKINKSSHTVYSDTKTPNEHEIKHNFETGTDNIEDMKKIHDYNTKTHIKPGDKVSTRTRHSIANLVSISANHHLGFGKPTKNQFGKDTIQHGILNKNHQLSPS